jgi:phosphomannomutase/phosphoglucomutase
MQIPATIFRDYDIRGVAGKEFSQKALDEYEKWYGKFPGITITPEASEAIGQAYGTLIRRKGGKTIVVGHEVRPYGEELKMEFVKGVLSTGCDIWDAGQALTPMVYFATAFYKLDGGVSVTGSHNVYFFNGFKCMAKDVYPVYAEELQLLHKMVEEEDSIKEGPGQYLKKDIWSDYRKYLVEHHHMGRKLKVVVDCGNGTPGIFAPELLTDFGCEVIGMYTEPDASFPNHVPDPEDPWMMRDLGKRVIEEKADLGLAFDADGDRCGVVDENGKFVWGDRIFLLLVKDVLSRNPGKKILYEVKCSRLMEDLVPGMGGIPMIHRTGHAPIKATLRKDSEVILGGEISGHFYFVENYFKIDDGFYSAAKILSLVSNSDKPISQMLAQFPETVMTPEFKLPCDDDKKQRVVESISDYFRGKNKTIDIDGVRVIFSPTSWGLVRASNTSPYLTIRVEADIEEEVIKIKNILADELEKYPEIGDKLDRTAVTTHTGRLGWV